MQHDLNILSTIFHFSDIECLRTLRQVCKKWRLSGTHAQRTTLDIGLDAVSALATSNLRPAYIVVRNALVDGYDSDGWSTHPKYSSSALTRLYGSPLMNGNSSLQRLRIVGFDSLALGYLCQTLRGNRLGAVTLIQCVHELCLGIPAQILELTNVELCPGGTAAGIADSNVDSNGGHVEYLKLDKCDGRYLELLASISVCSLSIKVLTTPIPSARFPLRCSLCTT